MASLQSSIAIFGMLSANSWWKVLIMHFNTDHWPNNKSGKIRNAMAWLQEP